MKKKLILLIANISHSIFDKNEIVKVEFLLREIGRAHV